MKVLIYSKQFKKQDQPYIETLLNTLNEKNIHYKVYEPFFHQMNGHMDSINENDLFSESKRPEKNEFDFVFSLGGDGTILHAITLVREAEIPICGINLGRLGFMATIEKTRIVEAIDKLINKEYRVEPRTMLELQSSFDVFDGMTFALNDFTLHKRDTSSMMIVHCYINNDFINSYWADGLVVSTPSGSTGYSLSCGGPIVFPSSSNFILTPVAPHNLNVRPLVVADDSIIELKIEGRSKNYMCTLDSRSEIVTSSIDLTVRKNPFAAHIVLLDDITFINTIRKKLNWGLDSRN